MKINAIAVNDTQFCTIAEEDRPYVKAVLTVYFYTPEERTHCCEITPSYDLRYLYTTLDLDLDTPEEKREELYEKWCTEPGEDTYMHCSRVEKMSDLKECGDFDDMDEAREYLQGNCPF